MTFKQMNKARMSVSKTNLVCRAGASCNPLEIQHVLVGAILAASVASGPQISAVQ